MNREIILRLRSPEGQHRITANSRDTFGQLLLQISKKLNYLIRDITLMTLDRKLLNVSQSKRLAEVRYFEDGAIIIVESKGPKKKDSHTGVGMQELKNEVLTSKCNHPLGGKCLNCISEGKGKQNGKDSESKESENRPRCNHGPGGRCLNCTGFDPKDKNQDSSWKCQHGPHAKCVHCLDKQFISDVAHISFDHFLEEKKLKCKGVHPSDVKCNNCLPPSQIRYEVDRRCKNHEPYPKAMCNKCIPPSVVVKRQEYRHVDYVEFMNIGQIQNFVKYWVQKKHTAEQRVGYLYGYYAEDPHYKGGIRVIVEAIYEPQQNGTYSDFTITENPAGLTQAEMVANGLSLERVGWIYTDTNHDTVMDEKKIRMAARMQEEYRVAHSSGYEISNYITVILRTDEKNQGDVQPEVYMISDQGQALERHNLFVQSNARKLLKVKVPQNNKQAYPSFIVGGKPATEFETEFLLVKIAHGSSKSNKFAILKNAEFPAYSRDHPSLKDLKEYLKKNKLKPSHIKYGDFNLLLYLAEILDIHTALSLAEEVEREGKVKESVEEWIESKADL